MTGGAALWRTPRVGSQALFGLLAQLTQGAAPVGLVLLLRETAGSLAVAGGVSAAMWVTAAVARPVQGRLMDDRGPRPVMLLCGPLHAAALIGLVAAAHAGSSAAALILLGAAAGAALPPVSASMRVEWGMRLPVRDRTAAYSLTYLTQEVAVLTGPLLVALLVAAGSASLALIVAAALSGAAAVVFGMLADAPARQHEGMRASALRSASMRALLVVTVLLGVALGSLQVAVPALAVARGVPALAGVLVALLSVGGITGAVVYGVRRWSADPSSRLVAFMGVAAAATLPLATLPAFALTGLLLALAGLAINPALTTMSLLVDRHSASRAAEAFGWLSTAVGGGTAAGNALSGALAQHTGLSPAFLCAGGAALAGSAVAAAAHRRLRRAAPARAQATS